MAENFEKSMAELEKIVDSLEKGEVTLEESLALFEKGVKLSKTCQSILDKAEKKVSVLVQGADGDMKEEAFPEMEQE